MDKSVFLGAALAAVAVIAASAAVLPAFAADAAKSAKYRAVFHVNDGGDDYWASPIGNVENLRESLGARETEVEVVAHGKGLGLVMATNEALAERMKRLAEAGVTFAACENTMTKNGVTKEQLLPFSTTVDSGVAQVVRRQEEGWSYVKP